MNLPLKINFLNDKEKHGFNIMYRLGFYGEVMYQLDIMKNLRSPGRDIKLFSLHFFISLPQDSKSFPQDRKSFPQVSKSFPQDRKSFPQVSKSFPQDTKSFPQLSKSLPQDRKSFPQVSKSFPQG